MCCRSLPSSCWATSWAGSGFSRKIFWRSRTGLVYYVFFPVLLFWKIGGSGGVSAINWPQMSGVLGTLFILFLLSLLYARITRMPRQQIGAFSQCCFRFNTYVGFAVILSARGEAGVTGFGVLISLIIPILNILSVGTLIWFSQEHYSFFDKAKLVCKSLITNPLIVSCLLGIAYGQSIGGFPDSFANLFQLLAAASLPLALLSIGQSLTFHRVKDYLRPALVSCLIKLLIGPLIGLLLLRICHVTGIYLEVAMIFLALPTSAAAYILSSQLKSDSHLASACIAMSTPALLHQSFGGIAVVTTRGREQFRPQNGSVFRQRFVME